MLKLNQQTVRNWIDQGSLPALRGRPAGADQALGLRARARGVVHRGRRGAAGQDAGPSAEDFWGGEPVGVADAGWARGDGPRGMSFRDDLDRQRAQIMRAVRQAGNDWAEAMRAHKLAPPDAGLRGEAARAVRGGGPRAGGVGARARRGPDVAPDPGRRERRAAVRASPGHRAPRPGASCGRASTTRWRRSTARSPARAPPTVADAFGELSEAAGALADAGRGRGRGGAAIAPAARDAA